MAENAAANGASELMSVYLTRPTIVAAAPMYSAVHTPVDSITAIGTSRAGFFASSAPCAIMSKPMYAKKTALAALTTPPTPFSGGTNGT
jgi:hypothetical protein